jgi:hypothetical protein
MKLQTTIKIVRAMRISMSDVSRNARNQRYFSCIMKLVFQPAWVWHPCNPSAATLHFHPSSEQ